MYAIKHVTEGGLKWKRAAAFAFATEVRRDLIMSGGEVEIIQVPSGVDFQTFIALTGR